MSDKDRPIEESLSALMDGEVSEFEFHRVIREFSDNDELRSQWQRYHLISSSLRNERYHKPDYSLCDSIRESLVSEPSHAKSPLKTMARPFRRFAVAASVAVIAVFGVQQYTLVANLDASSAKQSLAATEASRQSAAPVQFPSAFSIPRVPVRTVSTATSANQFAEKKPVVVLRKIGKADQQKEQEIEKYLNQLILKHSENSVINGTQGMMPLARFPDKQAVQD